MEVGHTLSNTHIWTRLSKTSWLLLFCSKRWRLRRGHTRGWRLWQWHRRWTAAQTTPCATRTDIRWSACSPRSHAGHMRVSECTWFVFPLQVEVALYSLAVWEEETVKRWKHTFTLYYQLKQWYFIITAFIFIFSVFILDTFFEILFLSYIYSISQKWVHPSHFCKYLIISFYVISLKK